MAEQEEVRSYNHRDIYDNGGRSHDNSQVTTKLATRCTMICVSRSMSA